MSEGQSCMISSAIQSSREQESKWTYMTYEILGSGNHTVKEEEDSKRKKKKKKIMDECESSGGIGYSLINPIGRDLSVNCLILCSQSDYGAIAATNRNFRDIIRSGELYKLRRGAKISEYWVYFSVSSLDWEAFDPYRQRWITVPPMPSDQCFECSDKESLAVGTQILVFGRVMMSSIVLKYSILTNTWSPAVGMRSERCLVGSASLGEKAIVAGGTDFSGRVLSTAEIYNSELETWVALPNMNKPRKMCSGVFMDGKFYVIGGMASRTEVLTCGEEYDLEKGVWRVIPNMFFGLNGPSGAPPLVAVVNNDLYAAHYGDNTVMKYNKVNNSWVTLGSLPERSGSVNGWGLAFRACGERLIVIGGRRGLGGIIEIYSWIPNEGPPQWEMIASKRSASFVYNCAIMGC